jgi:Tfp pilus assembly protein FimV
MVGRSARFLAPAALAAVTLGVYVIVHSALAPQSRPSGRPPTAIVNGRRQVRHVRHGPKFYVVKPGDTLSAIASKTGVSMTSLTSLNPSLATSPNSLQTGQRLRLRR